MSRRPDGRGHWPRGKRRSSVDPRVWAALRRRIVAILDDSPAPGVRSLQAIGNVVGRNKRTVKRWLNGEDYPGPDEMATLRVWYGGQRRVIGRISGGASPRI